MSTTLVFIIAVLVFLVVQGIQAFSTSVLIGIVSELIHSRKRNSKVSHLQKGFFVLNITLLLLLTTSIVQVGIWSIIFVWIGQFSNYYEAFYHSAVNFATLGYGDIVMDDPWRTLGALEAISGILMLGLSTATLSTVFTQLLRLRRSRNNN